MSAYYNEHDPYAAQWLRNLIVAGHIAPGDVDGRDIRDITPDELKQYTQCHFFAGIGVWSLALRNAGWPDSRPIWTGSCPCQPFSSAGRGAGAADERHLWPHWFHLIGECRPSRILGEQVASKHGLGWLDLVQTDLESAHYANAAVDLCAAGVGAPHIRQRLWFVAERLGDSAGLRCRKQRQGSSAEAEERPGTRPVEPWQLSGRPEGLGGSCGVADARGPGEINGFWGAADWLFCRDGRWRAVEPGTFPLANGAPARVGRLRAYGNAINAKTAEVFIKSYIEACVTGNGKL